MSCLYTTAGLWLLAAAASGCVARPPLDTVPAGPATVRAFDRTIVMNHHGLIVHLATPPSGPRRPLLVYATGDGGWGGKDLALYREIASWGYPAAGFSARDYVSHFDADAETTTPLRLARDYAAIIGLARAALHLPAGHPVILVGVSRGAGLSVVAAGQRTVRRQLSGVVAIALTREEEYVRWFPPASVLGGRGRPAEPEMVELYGYLRRLGSLPISVIQSTRDDYLTAADARVLFGPDTARRRLQAVDADDHSFGGARDEMFKAARASVRWVEQTLRPLRGRPLLFRAPAGPTMPAWRSPAYSPNLIPERN